MGENKIKELKELSIIVEKLRKSGKIIVHCHGVFDLIHPGHIRYFISAKKHGDILVVTLTGDRFVKKGPERPVFKEDLRAEVLAALGVIDYVAIVPSESAFDAIRAVKPHFYVKGPDYKNRKPNPNIPRKLGEEEALVKSFGGKLIFTDDITFSSSHLINTYLDVYEPETKDFLNRFRRKYTDSAIINDLICLKNKKVLVIGDAIIDEYHYSRPMGKSSKEPIVVHQYLSEETFAGGALASANHVAALSNHVGLVTLLGKEHSYESFIRKNIRPEVRPVFFYWPGSTVVKRRYVDFDMNQKLFQISYIHDSEISGTLESRILRYLSGKISSYDIVIVNDYGHGFLTKKIIRMICRKAKFLAVNAQANSANYGFHVITKYPRADFICIDDMELRLATHERWGDIKTLIREVMRKVDCPQMLITRGHYGSMSFKRPYGFFTVPALTQKIVDRVGAGDALFSIAAPVSYLGLDPEVIAFLGNVAAALKIQTIGNKTPIDFKEMTKFITRLLK